MTVFNTLSELVTSLVGDADWLPLAAMFALGFFVRMAKLLVKIGLGVLAVYLLIQFGIL